MKTFLVLLSILGTGCAATQEFLGLTPTECEARAKEIQERVEKATVQICTAQTEWKGRAAILDAAVETATK